MAEVEVMVRRGPRFFASEERREEDGSPLIMFEHVIDGANRIGPRPATDDDRKSHPEAWMAYEIPPAEDMAGAAVAVSGPLEIPASWRNLHHEDRKALAGKIAGRDVTTAGEADMIIRAEVERREAEEDTARDQV